MSVLQQFFGVIIDFLGFAFGPNSRLWPIHLAVTIAIAFVLYLIARPKRSFFAWALPRDIYTHPSHRTDLKLFVLGQALSVFGFFKLVAATTAVAAITAELAGSVIPNGLSLGAIPITILLVGTLDFTTYWVHRLHHEQKRLWPFHSVHHSAEVMTPFTVYRKHPVYDLLSTAAKGVLGGFAQGLLLAVVVDSISVSTIAGVNAGYFLFNIAGSNLRHTHIWLSYGPVIERILISPAQHQIHHSLEPRHFNKNYGEVFAFWDWMFGTLYVPQGREEIRFGLADAAGNAMPQRHDNLRSALLVPLKDSWRAGAPTVAPESGVAPAIDDAAVGAAK